MSELTPRDIATSELPVDIREQLARWAAEHNIPPHDPAWALVAHGALIHEWIRESANELEAAQRAATARIHRTGVAANQVMSDSVRASEHEVKAGLTREVRGILKNELNKFFDSVNQRSTVNKIMHWSAPIFAAFVIGISTALAVNHTQISAIEKDIALADALRKSWQQLPARSQKIIQQELKR